MLERVVSNCVTSACPDGNTVGNIWLGEAHFRVVLAHSVPDCDCVTLLELNGLRLAVVAEATQHATAADDVAARLTGRELQIAVLVAQGHATKNIAYRLQISEWTVATYMRRIFAKLNVDSRAAMVYRCAPLINARLTQRPPI